MQEKAKEEIRRLLFDSKQSVAPPGFTLKQILEISVLVCQGSVQKFYQSLGLKS